MPKAASTPTMPLLRLMAQASTLGIANVEKVQKQAFNPTGIKNVPASPTKVPKPLHSEASSSYGLSTKPIVIKIVEYTNSPDASDVAAQTDNKNSTKTGRQPVEAKTQGSAPKTKAAKEKEKEDTRRGSVSDLIKHFETKANPNPRTQNK